ncbi:MBL fold metallo-hydrolase [Halorubellus sp. JP-L1]|uniref:MBL fold metallo-hydrolase n=1 Tax=Halorubellus sp. JP-L1 TaxID=2715753 RepID=UPI00140CA6E5|nr:MBL fold metallo-hydrolase [Halorubellus sp. JP-L1]NHN40829.1 MBL fold metallo-hydrolase [Halorubellus sp. JP-L1]
MALPAGVHDLAVRYDDRDLDLHPVAVETDHGLVLVDVGLPGAVPRLREALDAHGFALSDVETVFLTHHDGDHAAALDDLEAETDAFVVTHQDEASYVDGREHPVKTDPDDDRYPPVSVDLELVGDETFDTAAGPMRVVETPGHSPGHCSLYLPEAGLLLAGDALVADHGDGRLHGPKPQFTPDRERARESVASLADLDVDQTLCYHGGLVDDGTDRIAAIATGST